VEVKKNGTLVSEYGYDPEGLRVVKKAHGETVHYVFGGMEPIFEKNISTGKIKNYIFAGMKPIARVDGALGDSNSKKYWITTDHIGNYRVVTNDQGRTVWQSDYMPFGSQYEKSGDPDFEEWRGFTGKELDPGSGLMYFNARWYDAETGRFISEDPVADPNNPNLYSLCANNPISRIDPTGNYGYDPQTGRIDFKDGTIINTDGDVISKPSGGSGGSGGSGNGGNNNGNSNNGKKSLWDGLKNLWDSCKNSYDDFQKGRLQKAVKEAEEWCKQHGLSKGDPEYEKFFNRVVERVLGGPNPITGIGWMVEDFAQFLGINADNAEFLKDFTQTGLLSLALYGLGNGTSKPGIKSGIKPGSESSIKPSGINPFKGKTPIEIENELLNKGFIPRGPNPIDGKGGYVNPKTGRSYHIDMNNSYGESPHVDVNRLRGYNGSLEKRKFDI
jgi:RHS repeat-associated protein